MHLINLLARLGVKTPRITPAVSSARLPTSTYTSRDFFYYLHPGYSNLKELKQFLEIKKKIRLKTKQNQVLFAVIRMHFSC